MSPDCAFVLDHYNDYLSGELSSEKVRRVEDHIRVCPDCEVFLKRSIAIHRKAVTLLRIPAPPSLRASISELMEKS